MIYEYTFIAISVMLCYLIIRPCYWQGPFFRLGLSIICIGFIGASSAIDSHPVELLRSFNVVCFGLLMCGLAIMFRSIREHGKCRRLSDWTE